MDGEVFAYDGKSGRWLCTFVLTQAPFDAFSGAADIALNGKIRCKVVVSVPLMTQAEGVVTLRRKCIDWIEKAEAKEALRRGAMALKQYRP